MKGPADWPISAWSRSGRDSQRNPGVRPLVRLGAASCGTGARPPSQPTPARPGPSPGVERTRASAPTWVYPAASPCGTGPGCPTTNRPRPDYRRAPPYHRIGTPRRSPNHGGVRSRSPCPGRPGSGISGLKRTDDLAVGSVESSRRTAVALGRPTGVRTAAVIVRRRGGKLPCPTDARSSPIPTASTTSTAARPVPHTLKGEALVQSDSPRDLAAGGHRRGRRHARKTPPTRRRHRPRSARDAQGSGRTMGSDS